MGNFNRNNRSDRPQMHQAVCDECGRNCEVPFKPSGGKPIYCSDCFKSKGGDDRRGGRRDDRRDDRGSGRRDFGGRDSGRATMHSAVCDECGQNCEVPFRPTSGKPIYCSNCFDGKNDKSDRRGGSRNNRDNRNSNGGEESSKQFKMLNEKLDKVLKILSASGSMPAPKAKSEPKKEIKVEKKPEKAKDIVIKKIVAKKNIKKKPAKKKAKAKAKKKK